MMMTMVKATLVMILIVLLLVLVFFHQPSYQPKSSMSLNSGVTITAVTEAEEILDWESILHFIPAEFRNLPFNPRKYKNSCLSLFTTDSSRQINVTKEMWEMRKVISKELKWAKGPKGTLTPEHPKLTLTYQELARQKFVHTVCEIGFNVGQSAIAWLTTKPDLELHSFDFGTLSGGFTKHMGNVLEKKYPGRFSLTFGDSKETVLKWAAKFGKKCDIFSIDGDHTFLTVLQDLLNMKVLAAKKNIIIVDDIGMTDVRHAWEKLLEVVYIHYLYHCRVPGVDVDYAIGYYPNV